MKKPVITLLKYIWKCITTDAENIDKKDNVKLAKELIFKDNTPQEIIFIVRELEKEVKLKLAEIEQKNEAENRAINLFFNPVHNSFKNRPAEIKAKFNYSFPNNIEVQEYAKC